MSAYCRHIASLLLLLFFRVMIPEAGLLALHGHGHTEEEANTGLLVGQAHTHCHAENLFNLGFAPVHFSASLPHPVQNGFYATCYSCVWKFTFPNNTLLRGPPVA